MKTTRSVQIIRVILIILGSFVFAWNQSAYNASKRNSDHKRKIISQFVDKYSDELKQISELESLPEEFHRELLVTNLKLEMSDGMKNGQSHRIPLVYAGAIGVILLGLTYLIDLKPKK